jgi:ATP-dependent Lhr-like helicase
VLYRDGVPIASLVAGQVELLEASTPAQAQAAARALSSEPLSRVAELIAQQASSAWRSADARR